jgi:hypothetical protein
MRNGAGIYYGVAGYETSIRRGIRSLAVALLVFLVPAALQGQDARGLGSTDLSAL